MTEKQKEAVSLVVKLSKEEKITQDQCCDLLELLIQSAPQIQYVLSPEPTSPVWPYWPVMYQFTTGTSPQDLNHITCKK